MDALVRTPENIDNFFQSIEPNIAGYTHVYFHYLAIKVGSEFDIVLGRVVFTIGLRSGPLLHFQSENVLAGVVLLADLGMSGRALVDQIVAGTVTIPEHRLQFLPNETNWLAANLDPLHPEGMREQSKFAVLSILGGRIELASRIQALDWELKSSPTPYDGLQELATALQVAPLRDIKTIEVIALQLALVDPASTITGTTAYLRVRLANGLSPENLRLGYRLIAQGQVVARSAIQGTDMTWDEQGLFQTGTITFDVPPAAVLQCFASYRGVAQHFFWVADPTTPRNPRRVIYEVTDPKLEILQDMLNNPLARARNARDFETAIASLLWMNGFSVLRLGGTSKFQDGPDLLVVTPHGHIAVVECTTGFLKADNKLQRLIERTNSVRRRLDESGNRHLRVLSAIVSSRPRADVAGDIEQAEKMRVLVVTKENIDQAVQRTVTASDADVLFDQGETAIQTAYDLHQNGQHHFAK